MLIPLSQDKTVMALFHTENGSVGLARARNGQLSTSEEQVKESNVVGGREPSLRMA